ncbi:keratin-associated protein 16-1-like [Homarus americanus]|uniref:keratin-associated protein 16-1-like n=1 Tax=Homarus americanus TaxID=6706 RepID=UPI001C4664AB|nr:keratin-associated protein 16-1-like [Homarus americanus]
MRQPQESGMEVLAQRMPTFLQGQQWQCRDRLLRCGLSTVELSGVNSANVNLSQCEPSLCELSHSVNLHCVNPQCESDQEPLKPSTCEPLCVPSVNLSRCEPLQCELPQCEPSLVNLHSVNLSLCLKDLSLCEPPSVNLTVNLSTCEPSQCEPFTGTSHCVNLSQCEPHSCEPVTGEPHGVNLSPSEISHVNLHSVKLSLNIPLCEPLQCEPFTVVNLICDPLSELSQCEPFTVNHSVNSSLCEPFTVCEPLCEPQCEPLQWNFHCVNLSQCELQSVSLSAVNLCRPSHSVWNLTVCELLSCESRQELVTRTTRRHRNTSREIRLVFSLNQQYFHSVDAKTTFRDARV